MKLIPLTQGQYAIVDDEDYEILSRHKWYAHWRGNSFYAARSVIITGQKSSIQMHRFIVQAELHDHVDHKDRNGLNNVRKNIRVATRFQNQGNSRRRVDNTSAYKGVTFHPQRKRWQARIWVDGKRRSLGLYDTPQEAHVAYCAAAIQSRGEFARFA